MGQAVEIRNCSDFPDLAEPSPLGAALREAVTEWVLKAADESAQEIHEVRITEWDGRRLAVVVQLLPALVDLNVTVQTDRYKA